MKEKDLKVIRDDIEENYKKIKAMDNEWTRLFDKGDKSNPKYSELFSKICDGNKLLINKLEKCYKLFIIPRLKRNLKVFEDGEKQKFKDNKVKEINKTAESYTYHLLSKYDFIGREYSKLRGMKDLKDVGPLEGHDGKYLKDSIDSLFKSLKLGKVDWDK